MDNINKSENAGKYIITVSQSHIFGGGSCVFQVLKETPWFLNTVAVDVPPQYKNFEKWTEGILLATRDEYYIWYIVPDISEATVQKYEDDGIRTIIDYISAKLKNEIKDNRRIRTACNKQNKTTV